MGQPPAGRCGITRRGFMLGAGAGLLAGLPAGWLGNKIARRFNSPFGSFTGTTREERNPAFAMPGSFPGRVVEVHHPGSVRADLAITAPAVKAMMDRGITELTGADHPSEAWKRFFEPGDIVGIKVNPVGRKPNPGEGGRVPGAAGSISSPEVLLEVVRGLKSAGVKAKDIIVFERYAEEFVLAGYADLMFEREMDGVRWHTSAVRYDDRQVDLRGFDPGTSDCSPEMARHVVGYDPDVFVHMGFAMPQHDPKDDRRFRTHLSIVATRLVNKIVTIPVLKDHRSAGVTLALKNLSHGMNNNVARSHLPKILRRDGRVSGPNQCNTFIPTAVSQLPTRQKATLHILDGLIGVYEGGPGSWNRTWGTWAHKSLFFATDPVAMDHVGWDIIDAKRVREGWPPVAQMGLLQDSDSAALSTGLARLASRQAVQSAVLGLANDIYRGGRESESFDRRQPEHVILAGELGLGIFDPARIEHRRIVLPS